MKTMQINIELPETHEHASGIAEILSWLALSLAARGYDDVTGDGVVRMGVDESGAWSVSDDSDQRVNGGDR